MNVGLGAGCEEGAEFTNGRRLNDARKDQFMTRLQFLYCFFLLVGLSGHAPDAAPSSSCRQLPPSKDARLRHGEGGGTSRMRTSASIALQSMSTIAAAAAESDWTMAWWSR